MAVAFCACEVIQLLSVLFCVGLELCINLALGLLQMKQLPYGDHKKRLGSDTHVFDRICKFSLRPS